MSGSFGVILPLISLLAGAFIVYLLARLVTPSNQVLAVCTAVVFLSALVMVARLPMQAASMTDAGEVPANGLQIGATTLRATPGALFISALTMGLGLCVAIYSGHYISLDQRYHIYYPLLLLMSTGILGMMMAADLFAIYLFCELMSIAAYVLVAFRRQTDTAVEAGFKYLVLGSVATLSMLLGIAWVYREAGTVALPIRMSQGPWMRAGMACFLVGLALKSGIVPLHTWLPDAYGRAPSSVGAFMAGVTSKSTLILMVQVALDLGMAGHDLGRLLILLSFANMTVGNLLALVQQNTKRLLAYSSIAQAGYIMFALGIGLRYDQPTAIQAGFFLLLAHAVMKGLAFLCKGVCHFYVGTTLVRELRGTFRQLPLVAGTFSLAMLGLVGFPPLAGFTAKWFILSAALGSGDRLTHIGVVVFLVNTLMSLGYYLPLIINLFRSSPDDPHLRRVSISAWMVVPVVVLGVLVVMMGVFPGAWLDWTTSWLLVGG